MKSFTGVTALQLNFNAFSVQNAILPWLLLKRQHTSRHMVIVYREYIHTQYLHSCFNIQIIQKFMHTDPIEIIVYVNIQPAIIHRIIQSKHAVHSHLVSYSSQLSDRFCWGSKEEDWDGWQIDGYGCVNGVGFWILSLCQSLSLCRFLSLCSCLFVWFFSFIFLVYLLTANLSCSNTIWKCCTAACCGPLSIMYYCSPVMGEK